MSTRRNPGFYVTIGLVAFGGYYFYKSQSTGQKPQVLVKEDWSKVSDAVEKQGDVAESDAQRQFRQLETSAKNAYSSAEQSAKDLQSKANDTVESLKKSTSENVSDWSSKLKGESDKANEKSKSYLDQVSGWVKGK